MWRVRAGAGSGRLLTVPSSVLPCDVADDTQIAHVFSEIDREFGGLDFVVHGAAFAPREAIAGDFLDGISREGFRIALSRAISPVMPRIRGSGQPMSRLSGSEIVRPRRSVSG